MSKANPFSDSKIRRRDFLGAGLGLLGLTLLPAGLAVAAKAPLPEPLVEPWITFDQVLQQLLPSETGSPGASEINSLGYLKALLEWQKLESEQKEFILNGVDWLNDIANQRHQDAFAALTSDQQDDTLRAIARSDAGERWLSRLLTYTIESLLTDPAYGGNQNGLGWRWLNHQPGFPRPDNNHLWYKL